MAQDCAYCLPDIFSGCANILDISRNSSVSPGDHIDEALPLAFAGMILGELWAATAGIGFFIVMSRATSSFAESTAMSLSGFALLVVISVALRCVFRRITSHGELLTSLNRVSRLSQ